MGRFDCRFALATVLLGGLVALAAGCSGGKTSASSATAPSVSAATTAPVASTTLSATPAAPSGASSAASANVWKGTVDPTKIPLGDGHVSTTPMAGFVDSCVSVFQGGGARHAGDWIDEANSTWSLPGKVAVQGSVQWSGAQHSVTVEGDQRVITTNDLPDGYDSGSFPISPAATRPTSTTRIPTASARRASRFICRSTRPPLRRRRAPASGRSA